MEHPQFEIIAKGNRWIIVHPETKNMLDDAQGYGYKSKQSAFKAAWFKLGGGKQKIDASRKEAQIFWNNHKDFAKQINDLYEHNYKEIARGEINADEEIIDMAKARKLTDFQLKYIKYL